MIKWLQDSYNGLYKIVLEPYMPRRKLVLTLIIGIIVGLVWGYAIAPTVYYNADPRTLEQSWQNEWVKLLGDRYANSNTNIDDLTINLLARVDDPVGIIDGLLNDPNEAENHDALRAIRPLAEQAQPIAVQAPQPSLAGDVLPFIIAPIVTAIAFVILALLWGILLKPNLYDPMAKRMRGERVSEEVVKMRQQVQEQRQKEATLKTDFTRTDFGPPLMQRMSTYLLGHGQYDDSYSIEDEQERFLGECGAGISETIGVGEPQRPTAVEVWLFDKDDFVKTITKVFASEHAFNDPAIRARLETKGDLVLAQPGAEVILETKSLRLRAKIVELEYGAGPLPTNSFFQKLTIELAAWRKDGDGAPVVAAAPATVAVPAPAANVNPPAPVYNPPPLVQAQPRPVQQAAPPPPAQQPLEPPMLRPAPSPYSPPPPAPRPAPQGDDPFGGTADFDPVT